MHDARMRTFVSSVATYGVRAIVLMLYLMSAAVATSCLRMLDLYKTPIEGEMRLRADMARGEGDEEFALAWGSAVVALVLLSLGVPVIVGAWLWHSRDRISTPELRDRVGLLYLAYHLPEESHRTGLASITGYKSKDAKEKEAKHARGRCLCCSCGSHLWAWEAVVYMRRFAL
jgi:hypothetical protein